MSWFFIFLSLRLKQKQWGRGLATESATAVLDYGFKNLNIDSVFAMTDPHNFNSKKVLAKLGFEHRGLFDDEGYPTDWFELTKQNWNGTKPYC